MLLTVWIRLNRTVLQSNMTDQAKHLKGACYVIDTREEGNPYGHIGIATEDSDGTEIIGLEANVDGFTDNNHDGINDQYQIGGPVRAVKRDWHADGTLYNVGGTYKLGKMVGWFYLPTTEEKKGGMTLESKIVNGDIFSGLITDVDPNVMNADGNRTTIDRIVIHHNAGTDDSNSRRTWYVSTGVGTSAHYQVTKHTQHLSLIHISEPTRPY